MINAREVRSGGFDLIAAGVFVGWLVQAGLMAGSQRR